MTEKTAEKPSTEKLVLFNHSRNPYHLKDGPNNERRIFAVGDSIECLDQAEYDTLKNYKGVTTTKQAAPGLSAHIDRLTAEKNAAVEEVAELKKQLEKFQSKGK